MKMPDPDPHPHLSLQQVIWRCMKAPDHYVMEIDYADSAGQCTRRIISPTRFGAHKKTMMALCLGREEVRHFQLGRIRAFRLVLASDVLMPSPIITLHPEA